MACGRLGQSNSGGESLTPRGGMRYISFMADKAAKGPTGVSRNGRELTHEGDVDSEGVIRNLQSASLTWIKYKGAPLQPDKEVVTVEMSRAYRLQRDCYRAMAFPPRPAKGAANWVTGMWKATTSMSIRCRKFITNAVYDKPYAEHWHGGNLDLPEVDMCCPLYGSKQDGQQHIIRECTHKKMVACRRRWDMHISWKVDEAAAWMGSPAGPSLPGYYRIATYSLVDLPEAYQMWLVSLRRTFCWHWRR